jgi:hypothetical protein
MYVPLILNTALETNMTRTNQHSNQEKQLFKKAKIIQHRRTNV